MCGIAQNNDKQENDESGQESPGAHCDDHE